MTNNDMHTLDADALDAAITQSRHLVEPAIDAMVQVIDDVTGIHPDRERVAFVSRLWLMHLCDEVVYSTNPAGHNYAVPNPDLAGRKRALRARLLPLVGSQVAHSSIFDPYLKIGFVAEFMAACRARRGVRWHSVPLAPRFGTRMESEKREGVSASIREGLDAESLLKQVIVRIAPVELVEHFHLYAKWADSEVDPRTRMCYTANAHQASLSFRHFAFSQRRAGSRIAIHQHGGGYGIDGQHLGEDHDVRLADIFYTWGWQRPDAAVRSLPTAPPPTSPNKSNWLLLMSLPVTQHFYRFQPFLIPSHVRHVVDETVSLCRELSDGTDLRIRSSGADTFPMNRLTESRAAIREDDLRESGSIAASRAQLVIHNYLGTSWLETLALNIPTVCFYEPKMYRPREAARPFIDALTRVGIIHHSGKEAARFINGLNGNPSGWWNSPEVQEARDAFVARYANFSEDWIDAWTTEFDRLLAEQ